MASRILATTIAAAALACLTVPGPAAAQGSLSNSFSEGYRFLKAVRERDGTTATDLIVAPGSVVVNYRDPSSGEGAIHILTRERDPTWLSFVLGKGARPDLQDKQGNTALAIAAQIGWIDGAERLLRRGANVDLANNRGETPLILAVLRRELPMVRLLLSKGADPRRTDNATGYSALDYARRDPRSATILKLLEEEKAPAKKVAGPTL